MTETMPGAPVPATDVPAENLAPVVEEAVPEVPILASLSEADPVTQATVPVLVTLIEQFNEIATKNASKTKGVDEIAADLFETSTDAKVVAIRSKIAELTEQAKKSVLEQAKAMKAEAGEPDVEAEQNAAKALKGVQNALATFPDGKRVGHFLPPIVSGTVGRGHSGSTSSSASGPKNDLSVRRTWAKANGFPDVADRGRLSDEIHAAYEKANPGK